MQVLAWRAKGEDRAQVVETEEFGKTLVLDDHTQSSARDEKSFHEALIHPAFLSHGAPKTVFIGGGGEGATAREALRWKSVEKVRHCSPYIHPRSGVRPSADMCSTAAGRNG